MPSIKSFIQDHPVSVIVTVIISSVSLSAGVVSFFASKQIELADIQHNHDIAVLREQLEKELDEYAERLVSIERRVGTGDMLFDVTTLMIPRTNIRALTEEYEYFSNGKFYVSAPSLDNWQFSNISILSRLERIFGKSIIEEIPESSRSAFSVKEIATWLADESWTVESEKSGKLKWSPEINVFEVDDEYLRRVTRGLSGVFEGDKLADGKRDSNSEIDKKVENLLLGKDEIGSETAEKALEILDAAFSDEQSWLSANWSTCRSSLRRFRVGFAIEALSERPSRLHVS